MQQPLLASELLGNGRDPIAPVKDAIEVSGNMTVPIDAISLGFWLRGLMGSPVTTGAGPYTHTFQSNGWTLPSMSIEMQYPAIPQFNMFKGVMVDGLSWEMTRAGLLTAEVALMAQDTSEEAQKDWLTSFVQDRLSTPERQISLSNIDGALGSDVSIREITISDQQGVWLRVNNASLNWNQAALFTGRLQVNSLKADSTGTVTGFRTVDGKGIGVVVELSGGQTAWFFDDEITLA